MDVGQRRVRVAVLWVGVAVVMTFSLLLYLLVVPGALEEAQGGQMEGLALDGGVSYVLALYAVVPVGMAVLMLLADTRAVQVLSLVAGLLVGAIVAFEVVGYLADGQVSGMVLASVVAALIAFVIAGLNAAELRRPGADPAPTRGLSDRREKTTV